MGSLSTLSPHGIQINEIPKSCEITRNLSGKEDFLLSVVLTVLNIMNKIGVCLLKALFCLTL